MLTDAGRTLFSKMLARMGQDIQEEASEIGLANLFLDALSGGGGSFTVTQGTAALPVIVNPAAGVIGVSGIMFEQMYVAAPVSGGAQNVTSIAAPPAGTAAGKKLILKGPQNQSPAADYLVLQPGAGLDISGPCDLDENGSIQLDWNGTNWSEDHRRQ